MDLRKMIEIAVAKLDNENKYKFFAIQYSRGFKTYQEMIDELVICYQGCIASVSIIYNDCIEFIEDYD